MPMIDFSFQGWVRGAEVTEAIDAQGKKVDVSKMSTKTLVGKLNRGALFISLGDYLYDNKDSAIDIMDFEETT